MSRAGRIGLNFFTACLFMAACFATAAAQEAPLIVSVDAAQRSTPPLQQGFLHGLDNVEYDAKRLDEGLLRSLDIRFWRIGLNHNVYKNYLLAKQLQPAIKITLSLSDILAAKKGGYDSLKPWEDWAAYEADVRNVVVSAATLNMQVDYWDIWSEPDTDAMWRGSCAQAMEMFKRTYAVIHSVDAGAKVVGPSVSSFDSHGACDQPFLSAFNDYIVANNLRFDAVSWHEFETPQRIPVHVDAVRSYFSAHELFKKTEIHINEYSGPADSVLAGWAVGWLAYLEQAQVDWSSRACWNGGCEYGLDGLFQKDNRSPRPLYWVHRLYAELPLPRLRVRTSEEGVAAVAAQEDATQMLHVLLGRMAKKEKGVTPRRIEMHITHYPYRTRFAIATIYKVIAIDAGGGGLHVVASDIILPVVAQAVSLPLSDVTDGDAYLVVLRPSGK